MTMDMKAFIDDRQDETKSSVSGNFLLFTEGQEGNGNTSGLTVTDDSISARSIESETMALGLNLSAQLGVLTPFVSMSYEAEDTTKAAYKSEQVSDEVSEKTATAYDSSYRVSAGVNFMLGSHIKGGIRMGKVTSRDDWEENYTAGSISIGF